MSIFVQDEQVVIKTEENINYSAIIKGVAEVASEDYFIIEWKTKPNHANWTHSLIHSRFVRKIFDVPPKFKKIPTYSVVICSFDGFKKAIDNGFINLTRNYAYWATDDQVSDVQVDEKLDNKPAWATQIVYYVD